MHSPDSAAAARLHACVTAILVATLAPGCSQPAAPRGDANASGKPATAATLFAAASVRDALEETVAAFEAARPGARVKLNFGASSTLARQIEAGAEADLFLSAAESWTKRLADRGLVARQQPLLGNRLVIVTPIDGGLEIREPRDLLDDRIERIAMADPASVPAGMYARQALTSLELWDSLAPKVAAAADVRQALLFAETGAAEAAIVYATDAAASRRVTVAARLAPELCDPIVFPLVQLKQSATNETAAAFYDFLGSDEAQAIFARHGFTRPASSRPAG